MITTYAKMQYTKADHVRRGMGLGHLQKPSAALGEFARQGGGLVAAKCGAERQRIFRR